MSEYIMPTLAALAVIILVSICVYYVDNPCKLPANKHNAYCIQLNK